MTLGSEAREGLQNTRQSFNAVQYMTQATATAMQLCDPNYDAIALGAGTASGDNRNNLYALPAGREGQVVWIGLGTTTAATGEAAILGVGGTTATGATTSTATGFYVLLTATDAMMLQFVNETWMLATNYGATFSTGT